MFTSRSARRVFAVGAASAALVLGGAAYASAGTPAHQPVRSAQAVPSSHPSQCNTPLVTNSIGRTCFQSDGDWQWVRDDIANGWTTYGQLETTYGDIHRYCKAPPKADGGGWCNWNVGEQGCVKYRVFETDGYTDRNFSGWSRWYSASTGAAC